MTQLTFEDLFAVPNMGATTILDFACSLEVAIESRVGPHQGGPSDSESNEGPTLVDEPDAEEEVAALSALLELVAEPWADQMSLVDPRVRSVVSKHLGVKPSGRTWTSRSGIAGCGTFEDVVEGLLDLSPLSSERHSEMVGLGDALRPVMDFIAREKLEAALEAYFLPLTGWDVGRLRAFYRRLGWGPESGETLENVGRRLGVTRERARQLEKKILDGGATHRIYMPAVERALRSLSEMAPISVDEASKRLSDRGVSDRPFHPEGVLKAAEILGFEHDLRIQVDGDQEFVTSGSARAHVSAVRAVALKQARASGASTVSEVKEELAADGLELPIDDVRAVLRALQQIEFVLDDWFIGHGKRGNRVASVARKMLSVANPLPTSSIREGVRREMRFRKTRGNSGWPLVLPPTAAVEAVLAVDPDFDVAEGGFVRPSKPLDYRTVLGDSERVIVDVLRSSPSGVLDRATLLEEVASRGGTLSTTTVMMTYSSIVQHLGVDLWTLRSTNVDPAAVEAVRRANALRPRTRRTLGHTWTSDGRLAVAYRIPPPTQSPVFMIPADVVRFVDGQEFTARTDSGVEIGSIRIYEQGHCGGYAPFLTASGAEPGDVLIVEFSIVDRTAVLRLEGDEVLEDFDFAP